MLLLHAVLGCSLLFGDDDKDDDDRDDDSGSGSLLGGDDDEDDDEPEPDADDDGFETEDGDCDDDDDDIHPDAEDLTVNGVDENCDGVDGIDEDGDGSASVESGGEDCDDHDATVSPRMDEVWYDGVDQDCDGADDYDQDADGERHEDHGGTDCEDTDPAVRAGAYDRPNDGQDQDCDGEDRVFDGLLLDEGTTVETVETLGLDGAVGGYDVAFLLDTTCSMSSWLNTLDIVDISGRLPAEMGDIHASFATFDDYGYGSFGSSGTDFPFQLRQQLTSDLADAQYPVDHGTLHGGGDGPESSMEALYQALTGAGYDLDCDGKYDSTNDVLPFVASASDPFAGAGGETYDAAVTGTGALGGVGFRENTVPIVVYITDNYMRDPDSSTTTYNGSPGGCPVDAGSVDVADAASDLGAWLVGIPVSSSYPTTQMQALSTTLGQYVDSDGDGAVDDLPVYAVSTSSKLNSTIALALEDIAEVAPLQTTYALVTLEVVEDLYGMVDTVSPGSYTNVDLETTSELEFEISWVAVSVDEALSTTVRFALIGDGETLSTYSVEVEVAPE